MRIGWVAMWASGWGLPCQLDILTEDRFTSYLHDNFIFFCGPSASCVLLRQLFFFLAAHRLAACFYGPLPLRRSTPPCGLTLNAMRKCLLVQKAH